MELLSSNVGGMYMWVWLLLLPLSFGFYYLFIQWWDTRSAIKKSESKILCLFHTSSGEAYWRWCWEDKGELAPADMKGYDTKAKLLAKKAIGKIVSDRQDFGYYFVLQDHVFTIGYPFEKPKINIRIAEYVENYPAPRVTANLEKWSADEYAAVTSEMAMASKDTTDLRAIISEAAGLEEKLLGLADLPKSVQTLKMLIFACIGAVLILGVFLYNMQSAISKIAAQFGIQALLDAVRIFPWS